MSEQEASEAFEKYLKKYIENRPEGTKVILGERSIKGKDTRFFSLDWKDRTTIPSTIALIGFIGAIYCAIMGKQPWDLICYGVFVLMMLIVNPIVGIWYKRKNS